MSISVGFIAPYPGLKHLARQMAEEEHALQLNIQEADLREAIPVVQKMEKEGNELIISRGGTAQIIREHTTLPVIEIDVSGYDIMRTLTLIKDDTRRSEVIGFPNVCRGVIEVGQLMDIEIPYTIVHKPEEVEGAVIRSQENGSSILIGDTITIKMAEKYGLQGILITSGRESVAHAFEQAKQLYQLIQQYRQKEKSYQFLLDTVQNGLVLVDRSGKVYYYNQSFARLFHIKPHEEKREPMISDIHPELENFLRSIIEKGTYRDSWKWDQGQLEIEGGLFHATLTVDQQDPYYYIRLIEEKQMKENEAIIIKLMHPQVTSFSQLVMESKALHSVHEGAQQFVNNKEMVVIYGEEGTEKFDLASAIHHTGFLKDQPIWSIMIDSDQDEVVKQIEAIVEHKSGTFYIEGLEKLTHAHQKRVFKLLQMVNGRTIFSFHKDPAQLSKEKQLAAECYAQLNERRLYIPPLRQRKEDLKHYIRIYIAESNAKFGKQVVGIRHKVMNQLESQPWPGNLTQLKQTIENLVQQAEGPYIEDLPFSFGDHSDLSCTTSIATAKIDLNQTLEEIEKDVIQKVLEEEDQNQTKTAERLGINRSTLWRKLKS